MSNANTLIIRVRGHSSLKRVTLSSNSTYKDLLLAVAKDFGVVVARIQLSKTPFHAPQIINATEKQSVTALGIKNGDMIYLNGDQDAPTSATPTTAPSNSSTQTHALSSSSSSSSSTSSSSSSSNGSSTSHVGAVISKSGRKLTPRCQHGPNGACFHCSGAAPTDKIEGKCNHATGATCIHCSSYVKDAKAEPAAWLCNHPETVFCPKCVPPDVDADGRKKALKCDCDKSKGQECIRCVETAPTIKVDKIPFSRYMKEKKGMCKFKHGPTVTCPSCAAPPLPSFAGKTDCNRGHAPWPLASCLACAPPNAILRQQPYRHCDSISLDAKIIQPFYFSWVRRGIANERAAVLFGRYVDEPEETKNPGAIRAMVYALYEPPQEAVPGGVKLTVDANDKLVMTLAMRLGLEPVGWVVCNTARSGSKYGGEVFLTGPEVQQAARFQHRYKNSEGFSRFVTLVIHHSTSNVEPIAFQISDQGVAMERDGVLSTSEDFNMLSTKRPAATEQIASVVYRDKVLLPGDEYLPDDLIVKVVVTAPKDSSSQVFKSHEFPSNGGDILIQNWLQTHAKEEFLTKLSDFNLLIALTKVLGIDIMGSILDCIRNRRTVPNDAKQRFESAITAKKLG